ncbi:MAG TPA: T9SS type A sorting domain-containing protein, partial [Bacteroidia bacterium]|nr:T9SS type A sorting domain-containing protein [Bacteroidia bacterium]
TVGNTFVLLDFDQICKIEFSDAATIEVSNDNGNTWTQLTYTQYLGTAPFQALGNRFSSAAYSNWVPGNNAAIPDNIWWHHETFDVSSLLSNASQCMVRFILTDANANGANGNYGWILDALKVTAAASELYPPVITPLNPIYAGNVFNLGPYTVNDSITDASGVASATLFYSVNSGPVQNVAMTNVSGNHWQGMIPAANDSDTICYSVQAWDASPASNTAVWPASGCQQFIVHAGITFPYFDNFDGTTLFTANNISTTSQWQLGTPAYGSTNSAHSAPNAWDVNLTTAYDVNADCELYSPVFDFSSVQNARLSFWHNWNCEAYYDGCHLEYTTDGNTWNVLGTVGDPLGTNWYTNATVYSSNTPGWDGASGGWIKSEYILSALNNVVGPVQFRFVFTSDASVVYDGYSIDDFLIRTPSPQDGAVTGVVSPDISSCLPQGNVPLSIAVLNDGTQPIVGPFDITYILDNGTPVTEQFPGTIQPGVTDTFTFVTPLNNTAGFHNLVVYSSVPGDGWNQNDTLAVSYNTAPGVTVPYFNGFENGPSSMNDFCLTTGAQGQIQQLSAAANTGTSGMAFDATSYLGWTFGMDTIPTSANYIWDPANSASHDANARLVVNTAGYNNLVLEFDAKLLYQYANEYTNFRVKVNGTMITPHLQPNNASTPYDSYRYDISSFLPAQFLTIDFEAKCTYDLATTGTGVYLDNIKIYRPDSIDVGVSQITQPVVQSMANTATQVVVKIKNYGYSAQTSIPVAYQVDNNPPVVETWTGNLLPNTTTTYTFTTTFNSPAGPYNLCSWTQLAQDTALWNDTTCHSMMGMPVFPVPFSDNFDGPNQFVAQTTYTPSWELGNPVTPYITGTHSGPNAWEVNLNGPYANGSNEILYSPFFDFSQATNVELRFWQWYYCDNYYDGGRVEYSVDGGNTWTTLGTYLDPNGTAWYNQQYLISSQQAGWSGNGGGYFQSKYNLAMFDNYPNPVQFRFVFTSDNTSFGPTDGWAIDDFELFMPINAGTDNITFNNPSPLPLPGNNTVRCEIKNTGTIPLVNVNAMLNVDNTTIVTDPVTFSPPLQPGQQATHTFSQPWTGASPGMHTVSVWTSNPNGHGDVDLSDDTTIWNISVMDTFATYPYCNDFETSNGIPPLTTMNGIRFTNTQNSFAQGTPAKNIINNTHSGNTCWVTDLTLNYLRNDSSAIFSPVFTVDTIDCYHLEFWTRYLTEVNHDGGVVEYSYDLGQTWNRLGIAYEPSWYMNSAATGLGSGYQPNFGGTSNGWVKMEHDFRFTQAGPVVFRFRFGSDNAIESEGWAIDDICFSQLPPCVMSVQDVSSDAVSADAYPNPSGTTTNINYNLPDNGHVHISLVNMLGQEVDSYDGTGHAGTNTWTVDVSSLPEGVYFYELTFGTQKIVQKLVVSH